MRQRGPMRLSIVGFSYSAMLFLFSDKLEHTPEHMSEATDDLLRFLQYIQKYRGGFYIGVLLLHGINNFFTVIGESVL